MKKILWYSVRRWDNNAQKYFPIQILFESSDNYGYWQNPYTKEKYIRHYLDSYLTMTAKQAKQKGAELAIEREKDLSSRYDLYSVKFWNNGTFSKAKRYYFKHGVGRLASYWLNPKTEESIKYAGSEKFSLIQKATNKECKEKESLIDGSYYVTYNSLCEVVPPFLAKYKAIDNSWDDIKTGDIIKYVKNSSYIEVPKHRS